MGSILEFLSNQSDERLFFLGIVFVAIIWLIMQGIIITKSN
jgi:hypothetical protein